MLLKIGRMARSRAARRPRSSASSTARTTTARNKACSRSRTPLPPRGSGTAQDSATARRSASSSAATGSRSTRSHRTHRPGRWSWRRSPTCSGRDSTAQMSYYETPAGAKVFAAGTLDFGGSATFWPVKRMLDNLWARLSLPRTEPELRSVAPVEVARARPEVLVGRLLAFGRPGSCLLGRLRIGCRSGLVDERVLRRRPVERGLLGFDPGTPSIVSSIRACSSVLKSG